MLRFFITLLVACWISSVNAADTTKKSFKISTPNLYSAHVAVVEAKTGRQLYSKNANTPTSIASITKLMTAMVVLDAKLPLNQTLTISQSDVDKLKNTSSRLPVGTKLPRQEMLQLALMSSENRAASALGNNYPGGKPAFVKAMNNKAKALGMTNTRFVDSSGLSPKNTSTAKDLVKMVKAASSYPLIQKFTTTTQKNVQLPKHKNPLLYRNTNSLVRAGQWPITVSKTGYISEAGHCLVMMATIKNQPMILVMLDAQGKLTPVGDANRIKDWLEGSKYSSNPPLETADLQPVTP